MVERAEKLALILQQQQLAYVLCHADLHGWNIIVENGKSFYIVDWDTMVFAPKERDLMFVGAGISNSGRTFTEEERLFYQGYGQTEINYDAVAYYRYARIIGDIGEYCEHIFLSHDENCERAQSFTRIQANFYPGGTIERGHSSFQKHVSSMG
jgi:spectinomycin phosphotransferase